MDDVVDLTQDSPSPSSQLPQVPFDHGSTETDQQVPDFNSDDTTGIQAVHEFSSEPGGRQEMDGDEFAVNSVFDLSERIHGGRVAGGAVEDSEEHPNNIVGRRKLLSHGTSEEDGHSEGSHSSSTSHNSVSADNSYDRDHSDRRTRNEYATTPSSSSPQSSVDDKRAQNSQSAVHLQVLNENLSSNLFDYDSGSECSDADTKDNSRNSMHLSQTHPQVLDLTQLATPAIPNSSGRVGKSRASGIPATDSSPSEIKGVQSLSPHSDFSDRSYRSPPLSRDDRLLDPSKAIVALRASPSLSSALDISRVSNSKQRDYAGDESVQLTSEEKQILESLGFGSSPSAAAATSGGDIHVEPSAAVSVISSVDNSESDWDDLERGFREFERSASQFGSSKSRAAAVVQSGSNSQGRPTASHPGSLRNASLDLTAESFRTEDSNVRRNERSVLESSSVQVPRGSHGRRSVSASEAKSCKESKRTRKSSSIRKLEARKPAWIKAQANGRYKHREVCVRLDIEFLRLRVPGLESFLNSLLSFHSTHVQLRDIASHSPVPFCFRKLLHPLTIEWRWCPLVFPKHAMAVRSEQNFVNCGAHEFIHSHSKRSNASLVCHLVSTETIDRWKKDLVSTPVADLTLFFERKLSQLLRWRSDEDSPFDEFILVVKAHKHLALGEYICLESALVNIWLRTRAQVRYSLPKTYGEFWAEMFDFTRSLLSEPYEIGLRGNYSSNSCSGTSSSSSSSTLNFNPKDDGFFSQVEIRLRSSRVPGSSYRTMPKVTAAAIRRKMLMTFSGCSNPRSLALSERLENSSTFEGFLNTSNSDLPIGLQHVWEGCRVAGRKIPSTLIAKINSVVCEQSDKKQRL